MGEEGCEHGPIKGRVYWEFIRAGAGPFLATFTMLSTVVSQVLFHGSDFWLTQWYGVISKVSR